MKLIGYSFTGLSLFFFLTRAMALELIFDQPIEVTTVHGKNIFHHLESAGRRNIAASENFIAITWEDNRNGIPSIYLAKKKIDDKTFQQDIKISNAGEAFEPSIIALSNNRFVVAWEENTKLYARVVGETVIGPIYKVEDKESGQVSLTSTEDNVFISYSRRESGFGRVMLQQLQVKQFELKQISAACPIDIQPVKDEQLYPAITTTDSSLIVAWEDRRPGHTIIMAAMSKKNSPCGFNPPERISMQSRRSQNQNQSQNQNRYGKGHGVSRVALATYGTGKVLATWADKRIFREGYDIYAAEHEPHGKSFFGPNSKVQDEFGGIAQQWHTTVSGNSNGNIFVAWDDNRNGDTDILLSWKEENHWSEDLVIEDASGPGEQNHPSIVVDMLGMIHVVWIHRDSIGGNTRIRYLQRKAE